MEKSIECVCKDLLNHNGELNDLGKGVLVELLRHLPPIHKGIWGPVFVPLTRLLVRTCVDLAIIKDGKFLLTQRNDEHFKGEWHFPGGSLGPGESLDVAAKRIAFEELGIEIEVCAELCCFNQPDNPRAHDSAFFLLCRIVSGEPKEGSWFNVCPKKLILPQNRHWGVIQPFLTESG